MKIRIVLTPQEKQALLEAGEIKHGDVEIVIEEGAKSRQSIIAEDARKSVQRKQWAFNFLSDTFFKILVVIFSNFDFFPDFTAFNCLYICLSYLGFMFL